MVHKKIKKTECGGGGWRWAWARMELTDGDFKRVCKQEYERAIACSEQQRAMGHDYNSGCKREYTALQVCATKLKADMDSINVNCGALLRTYRSCVRSNRGNDMETCARQSSNFIECANQITPLFVNG